MLTSAIVAKVITEGAFDTAASDTTPAIVLGWVNEAYRQMVGDAEWLRAERTLGSTTVVGQDIYDLPDDVIHVKRFAIDGNSSWTIVDAEELVDLKWSGPAELYGSQGAVALVYDEASSKQKLQVWPAPATAGLVIQVLVSVLPADLTTAPDTTPIVPADMHEALTDGAIGLGRLRVDERQDLAQPYLEKFQAAVGKLIKRRRSRLQPGAWQAGVGGRR